jgi:thioesterase domain-containing protein
MAQQLRQSGEEVPVLALVDVSRVAARQVPVTDRALTWLISNREHLWRWRVYTRERLRPMLRRWRAVPTAAPAAGDETEVPATRRLRYAQRIAYLHYRAQTYSGRVVLIQSDEFHKRGCQDDWARLVPAGLDIHVVAGSTHDQLLTEAALLRQTAEWLVEQLERSSPVAG